MSAAPLYGLVLAGGRSTRMKRDKAALAYHGATQLERAWALLEPWTKQRFISVRADQPDDALRARFPRIVGPKKDDICYATQNRQDAVKFMTPYADVVFVVGSRNSSNSNRLREVAALRGVPAYLVDNAAGIDPAWFDGKRRIGVTAGASAPEVLVAEVIARLEELSGGAVRNLDGVPEKVTFPLPKELQDVR